MADLNGEFAQQRPINNGGSFWDHITTIAHVSIIIFTLYVVYLCFLEPVVLFTWHPLLYAIGWVFLMTEAVVMLAQNNVLSAKMTHTTRVKWHWIFQTIAVSLSTIGFIAVVVNKNNNNKNHFISWHATAGLVSMIFCYISCCNGLLALYNVELRKYISPNLNKIIHTVTGILAVALGGVTLVLSLYTHWFSRRTHENSDIFFMFYMVIVFGIVWSLIRPINTLLARIQSV